MTLADTAFFIDLMLDDEGAVAMLDHLIEIGEPLWVPAITLHELYYGANLHENVDSEVARVRRIERAIPPVAFTAEAARIAGRVEAEMERAGQRPGRADVQIAAMGLARGEAVLTRDARFDAVDGLQVRAY